jgi:hypothetical protein
MSGWFPEAEATNSASMSAEIAELGGMCATRLCANEKVASISGSRSSRECVGKSSSILCTKSAIIDLKKRGKSGKLSKTRKEGKKERRKEGKKERRKEGKKERRKEGEIRKDELPLWRGRKRER